MLLAAFLNVYVSVSPIAVSVPISVVVVVQLPQLVVPPPPPPQPDRMVADESTIPSHNWRWCLVARINLFPVNMLFSFPVQAVWTKAFARFPFKY
jgi:hypothetical protein